MRDIALSETTVAQNIAFDDDNGWMYVTQLIQGGRQFPGEPAPVDATTRSNNGDMCINRLTLAGVLDSKMYVLGAGHGLSCEVVEDGRLWIDADASSGGFGRALALTTYTADAIENSDGMVIFRPFGAASQSHGLSCSVDLRFNKFAVRRNFPDPSDTYRYYLYDLNAAMNGDFSTPIRQVDQTANQPSGGPDTINTFQGFTSYGNYFYVIEGDPNTDNVYIQRLNWDTGVTQQKIKESAIFSDITYREPEGITMQLNKSDFSKSKLVFGFASGPGGARLYNIAYIPAVPGA